MSAVDRASAAVSIVRVCQRLYERGLVAGPDGNVSVRLDNGSILVTPSGLSKVDVTAADLVAVDLEGTVLAGTRPPSSEMMCRRRAGGWVTEVSAGTGWVHLQAGDVGQVEVLGSGRALTLRQAQALALGKAEPTGTGSERGARRAVREQEQDKE